MAHFLPAFGIIPAYAGSTKIAQKGKGMAADHPRIRGEHVAWVAACEALRGSSPHTRGARSYRRCRYAAVGIIPAYAGSTTSGATRVKSTPDHPRIRGEHSRARWRSDGGRGSSPHTRGALGLVGCQIVLLGIIPAYAGSTVIVPHFRTTFGDHPRIRGEHDVYDMVTARGRGSSPHTRGAPLLRQAADQELRIIPAYAGSTGPGVFDPPRGRDHPRIRGEHSRR